MSRGPIASTSAGIAGKSIVGGPPAAAKRTSAPRSGANSASVSGCPRSPRKTRCIPSDAKETRAAGGGAHPPLGRGVPGAPEKPRVPPPRPKGDDPPLAPGRALGLFKDMPRLDMQTTHRLSTRRDLERPHDLEWRYD